MGILSSVFVVRQLGAEEYAITVVLAGIYTTLTKVLSFGIPATITKLWIEFEEDEKRQGLVLFSALLQLLIILSLVFFSFVDPELSTKILGERFLTSIPYWGLTVLVVSAIIRIVFSSLLRAELNNKIPITSAFFQQIVRSLWLIFASVVLKDITVLTAGLIIIYFVSSLILVVGSVNYLPKIKVTSLEHVLQKAFLKKYFSYLSVVSVLVLFRYVVSPDFVVILLNKYGFAAEIAYYSIIMRFIESINNVVTLPTNKVGSVFFMHAFKDKNEKLLNRTYNFIQRYNIVLYFFILTGIFWSAEDIIRLLYKFTPENHYFVLFFLVNISAAILMVATYVTQIFEHYRVTLIAGCLATIFSATIYTLFLREWGLLSVVAANFGNVVIMGALSQVSIHATYKSLTFPARTLLVFGWIGVTAIFVGSLFEHFVISSSVAGLLFLGMGYFLYRPDETDRYLVTEVTPERLHRFVPAKYTNRNANSRLVSPGGTINTARSSEKQ